MAEEKADSGAAAAPGNGGGGGGSKLGTILTVVNLLATLGIGAVVFISFQKEKNKPKLDDISATEEHSAAPGKDDGHGGKKEDPKAAGNRKVANQGKMMNLEQFQVNLSTPGGSAPKYIRAGISLELPNDDTEAELNSKMPQVRNAIIDLFNSKRPNDIMTVEGRDYLKEEIRNALNGFLVNGKVKGVFITGYTVSN